MNRKEYQKNYRETHKGERKEYLHENREHINANRRDYYKRNKDKINKINKEYYKKNKAQAKDKRLRNDYGITSAEYDKMLEHQKGVCAICGEVKGSNQYGKTSLAVDHNHTTKKVRGLLCSCCNTALGLLSVDEKGISNLQNAIYYLGRNNENFRHPDRRSPD